MINSIEDIIFSDYLSDDFVNKQLNKYIKLLIHYNENKKNIYIRQGINNIQNNIISEYYINKSLHN